MSSQTIAVQYVIRHKRTGELMPQMKKGRGYSHWNPDNPKEILANIFIPRLCRDRKHASRIISMWAANPNGRYYVGRMSYYGDEDCGVDIKPDNRQKSDLEIVRVELVETPDQ